MFSKALFKQSCKANGVMWMVITFAVCFMLSCVMLISGGGSISEVKNAFEDSIIKGEINAEMESRSINYYSISTDGLQKFDAFFVSNYQKASIYDAKVTTWLNNQPKRESFADDQTFLEALGAWQAQYPAYTCTVEGIYSQSFATWQSQQPQKGEMSDAEYAAAIAVWQASRPTGAEFLAQISYMASVSDLKEYEQARALAINPNYVADSIESNEIVGAAICAVDPTLVDEIKELYLANNEDLPTAYDVSSLLSKMASGEIENYLISTERAEYRQVRSQKASATYIAGNMTTEKNIQGMVDALARYGVSKEKYDSFGYDYASINHTAQTTIVSYQVRYDYELELINQKFPTESEKESEEYLNAVSQMNKNLTADLAGGLLASLPTEVSSALEEVGQMDLYSLIVGSIFYKMAGLLLPIIYIIMASNNLVAGQVDSGSMAYVLSTSTKRKQVTFTQGLYLVASVFAMFCCTTITSCVCLAVLNKPELAMTYGKLILLNVGAFATLFAMCGICFFTSCLFDRSKHSMAIGGGLCMFFLVATMLGLFGSEVIPQVVRLDALNNFNYVSIISLFDVISIIESGTAFIWKFAILFAIGLVGFVVGSKIFEKKDLPL